MSQICDKSYRIRVISGGIRNSADQISDGLQGRAIAQTRPRGEELKAESNLRRNN
jgi:hypothetical protein